MIDKSDITRFRNAEYFQFMSSAMLTAPGNKLEPYSGQHEATGAKPMVDALPKAKKMIRSI